MQKYVFIAGQRKTLIAAYLKMGTFIKSYPFFYNKIKPNFFNFREKLYAEYWVPESEVGVMNNLGKKYLNSGFSKKVFKDINKYNRIAWKLVKVLNRADFSRKTDQELVSLFNQCVGVLYTMMGTLFLSQEVYTKVAEDRLMNLLHARLNNAKKANRYVNLLIMADGVDGIKKEELNWHSFIARQPRADKNKLLDYIFHNSWLIYNAFSQAEAYQFIHQRYVKSRRYAKRYFQELKRFKQEKFSLHKEQVAARQIFNREIAYLSQLIKDLAHARLEVKLATNTLETTFNLKFLYFISQKHKISFLDIIDGYFPDDLQRLLRSGQRVVKAEIQKRKAFVSFFGKKGKVEIKSGSAAKKVASRLLKSSLPNKNAKSVSGQVASVGQMGIVRGIASIIDCGDNEQLAKGLKRFVRGNIIVSTMTQPQIMPLARKAAGIITGMKGESAATLPSFLAN